MLNSNIHARCKALVGLVNDHFRCRKLRNDQIERARLKQSGRQLQRSPGFPSGTLRAIEMQHFEQHFSGSDAVRDVVIAMGVRLTVRLGPEAYSR